jgi:hypothetical protein
MNWSVRGWLGLAADGGLEAGAVQADVADEQVVDQLLHGSRRPTPGQKRLLISVTDVALELLVG